MTDYFLKNKLPFISRFHDSPNTDKLNTWMGLLKKKGYLIDENYFSILNRVMENASDLFREYFLLIMDQGEMLSFPVLEKYIKCTIRDHFKC